MQRRQLIARAALAACALLATAGAAHAQAPEWKKIRIGVEGAYPPFSEVGADGKLKGFEIDLALALCAEIKAECTLVQQDFDGLIPALQSRKVDAIIASVSITDERKKVIAFSNPYYNTPAGKGYAFVGPSYDDVKYFGVGSGVGMRKADEKTLGKKFNDAIAAVKANGTFKKLNDKYFEYDISGKTGK